MRRSVRRTTFAFLLSLSLPLTLVAFTGCHSIHSGSVRDLIQLEGAKIDAAQTNIDLFQKETEARITENLDFGV